MTTICKDFSTEHLTKRQRKIAEAILKAAFGECINDEDYSPSGNNCQAFHRPEDWAGEYGKESVLVVSYSGSDLWYYISMDGCYESAWIARDAGINVKNTYASYERVQAALKKMGYYLEECTSGCSAVYKG